jgi:hypothetical protein
MVSICFLAGFIEWGSAIDHFTGVQLERCTPDDRWRFPIDKHPSFIFNELTKSETVEKSQKATESQPIQDDSKLPQSISGEFRRCIIASEISCPIGLGTGRMSWQKIEILSTAV